MSDEAEIRKIMWKKMADSPFVMVGLVGSHDHSEPMTAQLDENADSAFWFYTKRDNRLAPGGPAMAQFAAKGHDLFACIMGTLTEETDPAVIDRYWSKQTEAWFDDGRNDPSLLMLRFDLKDAEIWDARSSPIGIFKMLTGTRVTGDEVAGHAEVPL